MAEPVSFRPGDIVEVQTPTGVAYVQLTHMRPPHPEILRVLPGSHAVRPDGLEALAAATDTPVLMFPLTAAVNDGRLKATLAGHAPVPPAHRDFPLFRIPIRDRSGAVLYWWHWDGNGLSLPDPEMPDRPRSARPRDPRPGCLPAQALDPLGSLLMRPMACRSAVDDMPRYQGHRLALLGAFASTLVGRMLLAAES